MDLFRPLLVTLLLCSGAALAEDTRWGLRWTSPEGCIDAAELSQAVEERLGKSLFGAPSQLSIHGNLRAEPNASGWKAKLTLVRDDGTVMGSREVTSQGPSCRGIDASLVVVVTVMIDPSSSAVKTAQPVQTPSLEAKPAQPGVFVHLDADNTAVRLYRQAAPGPETVCAPPCDLLVERPFDSFFVSGENISMTDRFSLHEYKYGVDLDVRAGSATVRGWGAFMVVLGIAPLITGIALAIVSATSSGAFSPGPAAALAGGGAVLVVGGIALFRWGYTEVTFAPRPAP
jgi:hypothetical protein